MIQKKLILLKLNTWKFVDLARNVGSLKNVL